MRRPIISLFISLGFLLAASPSFAQKKIAIMGSSTVAGAAADATDSTWVARLQAYYRKNTGDGLDTVISTVAEYGAVTYFQMPSIFVAPSGRPAYHPGLNIDQALSVAPDILIINLPSNDMWTGQYTKKEVMDNFRYLRSFALAAGVSSVFITTTQPRNDPPPQWIDSLHALRDSIINNFGIYSINFWDTLVTHDGTFHLRDEVRHVGNPDEDYHLNDVGHRYIFFMARDRNLFSPNTALPLNLTAFGAALNGKNVNISWHTELEDPQTFFEVQRSGDAYNFETIYRTAGRNNTQPQSYAWTDYYPLPGKSFYRLKIIEGNNIKYSQTISIETKPADVGIGKMYKDNASSTLVAEINVLKNQSVVISIINMAGAVVEKKTQYINSPSSVINMPIANLAAGQYFLRVGGSDNVFSTRAFEK